MYCHYCTCAITLSISVLLIFQVQHTGKIARNCLLSAYPTDVTFLVFFGLYFVYCSSSLRHVILYCNNGWCVKNGVVHRSRQQWLIAKWLGLGVTVRIRVRARAWAREWIFFSLSLSRCVKVTKIFVLLS